MRRQLRRSAVAGVGWAFFSSTFVRVIQVVAKLVLAKLLVPEDFGVFALAVLLIDGAAIFRDVGFSQVLIYQQRDVRKGANTAFFLGLGMGIGLGGALFLLAPMLGRLFDASQIVSPIRAMSAVLVVSVAANVPLALLDKDLKFKKRAVPEVSGALVYALVSIGLAATGFRAWSLVIGWIAMSIATTVTAWMVSPWRPSLEFDWKEARVIVGYGKHLMIASLVVFAFFQIDKAAVGKWLGLTAVGLYSMAFIVCNLPATNLSHVVNRVMFPTYSRLQDDLQEMRSAYLQTIRYISIAAFPAAVGIMVLSGPVITAFYGEEWMPAIPLFHVLAFFGLVRSIGATTNAVFMATGNPGLVRRVSLMQLLVAGPLVYMAAQTYGAIGVAILFTGAYLLGTVYALAKVQRILGIEMFGCLKAVSMPLSAAGLAGLAAWFVSAVVEPGLIAVLLAGAVVGSAYGLLAFAFDRSAYGDLRKLLISRS